MKFDMKNIIFKSSKSEKRFLKLLDENITDILSVGISTGGSAEINMAKKCPQSHIIATTIDEKGLDFTNKQLKNFEEAKQITTKIEDVSKKMPYKNNTFDVVYARLVLHYLTKQQLEASLKEVYRVLKPSGLFFVVVRNNKEWEISDPKYIVSYDEKTNMTAHYEQQSFKNKIMARQFLSEEQLKEVLQKYNFKIKTCKSYKERLYRDYERTIKSKKPNSLTEVVAVK